MQGETVATFVLQVVVEDFPAEADIIKLHSFCHGDF